jgi:hypothetical protein
MRKVDKLPEGAVQIHFGSPESYIERLLAEEFEHIRVRYRWLKADWTNPKYGDAITPDEFNRLWRDLCLNQMEGIEEGFVG